MSNNNTIKKTDIIRILTLIRLNFENAYKCTNEEKQILIDSWYEILKPYTCELVLEATRNVIGHASFVPHLGDIVKEIERLAAAFLKSDNELWKELMSISGDVCHDWGVYRAGYTYKEDNGYSQSDNAYRRVVEKYNQLPWELKEFAGSVSGLADICAMEGKELQIAQARFVKQLPQMRERKTTRERTSEATAKLLTGGGTVAVKLLTQGNDDDD